MYALVRLAASRGLAGDDGSGEAKKIRARRTGIRGETLAYWYLRRHGYVVVARNYTAQGLKGELDLVGYEGEVLVFVEVKTRSRGEQGGAPPEEAVTHEKQHRLRRVAARYLRECRSQQRTYRFDVLAIESRAGTAPVIRLTKDAF
jgi:putative endonuclease